MNSVECIGFSPEELTSDERDALLRLAKHSEGLLGMEVYPNLDVSDVDNIPTGVVMYFDPSAKVDPTMIHDKLFESTAVSKVLKGPHAAHGEIADEAFSMNRGSFLNAVPQYSKAPARPEVRTAAMKEMKPWHAEMGGDGSFVGAYSQLEPNHRDKTYYLVSRGTVPLIVQNLKEQIASERPTFRELVSQKDWATKLQNGKYMAQRNVQRNLVNMAAASQVAVSRIRDLGSKRPTPDHAYPVRAVPEWQQVSHDIRDAKWAGKPAVAVYSGVLPAEDRRAAEDVFVAGNPYDGITVFPVKGPSDTSAYPIDTGRNARREAHTAAKNARAIQERARVVAWENQQEHPLHSDVAPDAWKPINETFKTVMKRGGWNAEHGTRMMIPIVVKVYNPEHDR